MSNRYQLALHVFRRDLRLEDNSALIAALESSKQVIPVFIFDPRQIEQNDYKSENAIQFMAQSLQELDKTLREKGSHLYFFYGIAEDIVANLLEQSPIEALFINRDYTPFSVQRDQRIKKICKNLKVDFHNYADALLHEPEIIHKSDDKPYTIFTPFLKKSQEYLINKPHRNSHDNYFNGEIKHQKNILKQLLAKKNPNLVIKGGRKEGLALLNKLKSLDNYSQLRNFPALNSTTYLSAHNKFGTISIREFYHLVTKTFGIQHDLIKELYWRDFFTHIGFHFPHVFANAFQEKYQSIKWHNNEKYFRLWCEGLTGFPIVDAGMRELNTTGFMHNRIRMIVASFLVKDLHIDWRWGEQYFANKLVDYDPAVNNGNWQWVASTGCDAQPYFRIFNPWLQQQKFDPECLYIKRWIPELARAQSQQIHDIERYLPKLLTNYPAAIVNHAKASEQAKVMYSAISCYKY